MPLYSIAVHVEKYHLYWVSEWNGSLWFVLLLLFVVVISFRVIIVILSHMCRQHDSYHLSPTCSFRSYKIIECWWNKIKTCHTSTLETCHIFQNKCSFEIISWTIAVFLFCFNSMMWNENENLWKTVFYIWNSMKTVFTREFYGDFPPP